MPVLQCISSFEGTSYPILQDIATSSFISCCFKSVFTSADIIFYNFSELESKLSKKTFSSRIFFFNELTQIPLSPSPLQPKSTKRNESFLSMLPNKHYFQLVNIVYIKLYLSESMYVCILFILVGIHVALQNFQST